jgi:hypothetical protein
MSVSKDRTKTIALLEKEQREKFKQGKLQLQAEESKELTDGETVRILAERYLSE